MEFIDLKKQYAVIREEINARINTVLEHGNFIMGAEVGELEKTLALYAGRKHCISCASGTDALLMALMAIPVQPGDIVFTTTFSFIATAEVISLLGAKPVFVDIDERTYNIDPDKLEAAIRKASVYSDASSKGKPRAIIAVDIFGLPADYDALQKIAEKYNVFLIEDAAQSFGADYKGKKSCAFGQVAATSFFPAKPLGCYGDGGALFTDDDNLAERLKSIRVHGKGNDKYDNVRIGINGRLDTLQAAILLVKYSVFEKELATKRRIAEKYCKLLNEKLVLPYVPADSQSAWAQFSVRSEKRDAIMQELKKKNIPTAVYYPKPLHLQTAFAYLGYTPGMLPIAEKVCETIFSLPMHAYMTEQDIRLIADELNRVV